MKSNGLIVLSKVSLVMIVFSKQNYSDKVTIIYLFNLAFPENCQCSKIFGKLSESAHIIADEDHFVREMGSGARRQCGEHE